jgi:hypothetical protein
LLVNLDVNNGFDFSGGKRFQQLLFFSLKEFFSPRNMFICKAEDRGTLLEVRTVENADAPRLDRFG